MKEKYKAYILGGNKEARDELQDIIAQLEEFLNKIPEKEPKPTKKSPEIKPKRYKKDTAKFDFWE